MDLDALRRLLASARARLQTPRGQVGGPAIAALLAWFVLAQVLPKGAPTGVVVHGIVLGALSSLTAIGLVLVYRSTRIINFAQAEIGGLAATVAVIVVIGWHQSYWIAVPAGLAVAVATGAVVDAVVVRRFFTAPRLILTVATVGVAQIIGAGEVGLPTFFAKLRPLIFFKTPFHASFTLQPFIFHGDDVLALLMVPVVVAGLAWFLSRSDTGVAVRAAADSNERALLLGIPVRRLSRVTWMVAAGLSGIGSILSAPILGPHLGVLAGPGSLLAPMAAAVIGRMESLPVTVAAALGIGVAEQLVFWSYPQSSTVDLALFGVILVALLLQRRRVARVDDSGLGGYVAVREVRPIPAVLRSLPEVRLARLGGLLLLGLVVVLLPLTFTSARLIEVAYIAIYGIVAVSLVVLIGWAGQISLGQFAFAGIGAATTASLLVHADVDLFAALVVASLAGAVTAVLVGFPALRIRGLFLAVTTLAFAVPVSTWLLNSTYFPKFNPNQLVRPVVFERFDLESVRAFYFFCLAFLVVAVIVARNYRRSRAGRTVVAVRDNEKAAASYAINPIRTKLAAFAISGAIAGVGGGLFGVALRGIPFRGFDPVLSLQVFTMVVLGGLGSIGGAVLGATYFEGVQAFLHGATQLLATGGGVVLVLMVVPGGLAEVFYALRDRALRALARSKNLSVPSLMETADDEATKERAAPVHATLDAPLLTCEDIDAGYGQIQVLFGVDLDVADGEIVALLGTNGAGKSTVLKVISGLMGPTRGRLAMGGTDLSKLSPADRVRAGVVLVPGGRGVFPSLTVAENLRLAGWLARKDKAFIDEATARAFELFPVLEERLDSKASLLSGGEQQMLTIAQALLCRPKLLMIDELSLGLAPIVVATLLDVVKRINADGTTVIVVEQSVNVATSIAQRAVFMERGQVRFSGPTKQLEKRPDLLRSVFLRSGTRSVRARAASTVSPKGNGSGDAALRLTGISKRFGGVTAINDVELDVPSGHILGIIGSNGAGKTTLFDIASGFLVPDSGRMYVHGRDVTDLDAPARAELGLGRSFQDARLFPSMTVAETLATALERHLEVRDPFACMLRLGAVVESEKDAARRVDELIELMNLQRYRDAFVSELSTGTRRIVELTCGLAHAPSVLLLDEPSSGIAQKETEALGEVLLDVKERTGATLAVIEHDIPLISSIADELVCLHLGEVIASGPPAKVLADPMVVASYLGNDPTAVARSGRTRARSRAAVSR